jgi:hypothetical protein
MEHTMITESPISRNCLYKPVILQQALFLVLASARDLLLAVGQIDAVDGSSVERDFNF